MDHATYLSEIQHVPNDFTEKFPCVQADLNFFQFVCFTFSITGEQQSQFCISDAHIRYVEVSARPYEVRSEVVQNACALHSCAPGNTTVQYTLSNVI